MSVTILLFASAKEACDNLSSFTIPLNTPITTDELKGILVQKYPSLGPMFEEGEDSLTIALNEEYLLPGVVTMVKGGDEVALIPPISGG